MNLDQKALVDRLRRVEGEQYRRLALDAAMMIEYLAGEVNKANQATSRARDAASRLRWPDTTGQ